MPILARETDCFPEDLLNSPPAEEWWAIYTMARREKDLMRKLHAKQIPFYSPTIQQAKKSPSGRIRTSFIPLFSGYVFLNGSNEDRYKAMTTNCVSRATSVTDADSFLAELRRIDHVLRSGMPVSREERLEPGDMVRVIAGPLKGLEGTLLHRKGGRRICVSVSLVQQGVSVELDDCDVRAV